MKTTLFPASASQEFLHFADGSVPTEDGAGPKELQWIEAPSKLGEAPGESGFSSWLLQKLPHLAGEVDDPHVCFGVSVGGDVDHSSGKLKNWWPGGGHPRQLNEWLPSPRVADIMGLPHDRTFVLHDGEAHLLGCSRCAVPPPGLGCLTLGTGVGFGLSDSTGAVVDSSSHLGRRSYLLNGVPISGARYAGIWKQWLRHPGGFEDSVDEVMSRPFANIVSMPWRMPWVSLVLGRRGMELAEAAHGCPAPGLPEQMASSGADLAGDREPAVRAYGEQWLHFLHTQFIPQFCGVGRPHPVQSICFAGGVAELNWPLFRDVLVEPGSGELHGWPTHQSGTDAGPSGRKTLLRVLPLAPSGSGLIGAGIYALAGVSGAAMGIWAS